MKSTSKQVRSIKIQKGLVKAAYSFSLLVNSVIRALDIQCNLLFRDVLYLLAINFLALTRCRTKVTVVAISPFRSTMKDST